MKKLIILLVVAITTIVGTSLTATSQMLENDRHTVAKKYQDSRFLDGKFQGSAKLPTPAGETTVMLYATFVGQKVSKGEAILTDLSILVPFSSTPEILIKNAKVEVDMQDDYTVTIPEQSAEDDKGNTTIISFKGVLYPDQEHDVPTLSGVLNLNTPKLGGKNLAMQTVLIRN